MKKQKKGLKKRSGRKTGYLQRNAEEQREKKGKKAGGEEKMEAPQRKREKKKNSSLELKKERGPSPQGGRTRKQGEEERRANQT